MNEEKINKAFDEQYSIWKGDASQQLKTAEDEAFEMLERQLSGWRKRQIENGFIVHDYVAGKELTKGK